MVFIVCNGILKPKSYLYDKKKTTFLQLRWAKYFLFLRGLHCSSTGIFMACIKKNIFLCKTKPSILPANSKWMTKAPCTSRCSSESCEAVQSADWTATMRNKPFMLFNGILKRDFKKDGEKRPETVTNDTVPTEIYLSHLLRFCMHSKAIDKVLLLSSSWY